MWMVGSLSVCAPLRITGGHQDLLIFSDFVRSHFLQNPYFRSKLNTKCKRKTLLTLTTNSVHKKADPKPNIIKKNHAIEVLLNGCKISNFFDNNYQSGTSIINKLSSVMTSPGPAFQECTGSCHENVPALKAVSSNLRSSDGLFALVRI